MEERSWRFDNLKLGLIALVVFGHLLELCDCGTADLLYRTIYLFHMPAFLFVSGYFSRFSLKKLLARLVWPYLIFQALYRLFAALALPGRTRFALSCDRPYWVLWYLLVLIGYHLLVPLLELARRPWMQVAAVLVCWGLSLGAGAIDRLGYRWSLARFFTFLPFFVLGFYSRRHTEVLKQLLRRARRWLLPVTACAAVGSVLWLCLSGYPARALYGSMSYHAAGNAPWQRGLQQLMALDWLALLMLVTPERCLPGLTLRGRNTLPVFLLHGFPLRLAAAYPVGRLFLLLPHGRLAVLALLAAGTVMALSGSGLARGFALVFPGGQRSGRQRVGS